MLVARGSKLKIKNVIYIAPTSMIPGKLSDFDLLFLRHSLLDDSRASKKTRKKHDDDRIRVAAAFGIRRVDTRTPSGRRQNQSRRPTLAADMLVIFVHHVGRYCSSIARNAHTPLPTNRTGTRQVLRRHPID